MLHMGFLIQELCIKYIHRYREENTPDHLEIEKTNMHIYTHRYTFVFTS